MTGEVVGLSQWVREMNINTKNSHLTMLVYMTAGCNTPASLRAETGYSNSKIYTLRSQLETEFSAIIKSMKAAEGNQIWVIEDYGFFDEEKIKSAASNLELKTIKN